MAINHIDNFGTNLTTNTNAGDTTSPLNSIPSIAAPFYIAFDATNINGHYEVKQITSKTSTNVNHSALAYAHSTAEEVRCVVPAVEFDNFQTKDAGNGWLDSEAATFVSADGSTGILNIGSDVTGKYSPGMRYKYQQDHTLTAYWNFNSNSLDQAGTYNGTDTAITYTSGKFSNNAATFNGTTSKIVIADNSALKPTGEFTIGCWFKTGTTGSYKILFQSNSVNTNTAGIVLRVSSANTLEFVSGKNTGTAAGTDFTSIIGSTTVTDNTFHYAVASFRNNYMQLYLDGKLEAAGYCLTPAYAATNYVRVGVQVNAGVDANFFNGQIDDLFLINGYALDEKTIKAKYDSGNGQGTSPITVQKYALISAVGAFSGGVTPITIWGGTDYSLANATISNPYYATVSSPFGFNSDQSKWKIEITNNTELLQNSPTAGTWYNVGTLSIPVHTGTWRLGYSANIAVIGSSGQWCILSTLSSTNNSASNANFTRKGSQNATSLFEINTVAEYPIAISSKTSYYLNLMVPSGSATTIRLNSSQSAFTGTSIIYAISTLL